MTSLTFTVPLPPNMANGRRHWRTALRDKKAYANSLTVLYAQGKIPKPPREPLQSTQIRATLYVHQPMDDDNALARLKHLIDFFVRFGYIVDDSRKNLRWAGMPDQVIDRKNPRVELTLTPIATNEPEVPIQ